MSARPGSYSVELVECRVGSAPAALKAKWFECAARSSNWRAVQQTPEWVEWRAAPAGRYHLAVTRDPGGEIVSVSPLREEAFELSFGVARWNMLTLRVNALLIVGNIPAMPESRAVYDAFFDTLAKDSRCNAVSMLGVPKESAFWSHLNTMQRSKGRWIVYTPWPFDRYHFIRMPGSFGEYLARFSSKTRQNLKRQVRVLREHGNGRLELDRVTTPGDVDEFLAGAREIARASWQKLLVTVPYADAADRSVVLTDMARAGLLQSYLLKCDGKACAYGLGFRLNGTYFFQETAFDPAWERFSPGKCLLYLMIEDLLGSNAPARFWFGPGTETYKQWFANGAGEERTVFVLRNTRANRLKVGTHRAFCSTIRLAKRVWPRRTRAGSGRGRP
ncbi:MAG TPA: GNAT family N-acetyltransferase [Verrucomicrobiae bacterium]